MTTTNKLAALRIKHKLSQNQMAKRLNITQPSYNYIENGRRAGNFEFWAKLGTEFNLSLKKLIIIYDDTVKRQAAAKDAGKDRE